MLSFGKAAWSIDRTKLAALILFVAAAWMLQHPYFGVVHDSAIYTLLAEARLYPLSLSHDVFLRFGSQGRYTLFTPMYAAAIRWLDLDPAASLLTFLFQVAFFAFAYIFCRRFMSARLALLGIGFLAVLPAAYGSSQVFHCIEDFVTPRLPAEALVLAGLAALLTSRRVLGGLCLAAATILHPIMASAGFALAFVLFIALPRPKLGLWLILGGFAISLALLAISQSGPLRRLDTEWYQVVRTTSPFLFPSGWSIGDWSRLSVRLAVLGTGWVACCDGHTRRLCAATLITALGGVLFTLVYCDLLHLVLATEMQLWRWLWLSTTVAIGLAPLIATDCWKRNASMRAVPILLAAACLLENEPIALALSALAVASALGAARVTATKYARLFLVGAMAILIAAAADYGAIMSSFHPAAPLSGSTSAVALKWWRDFGADGVLDATALSLLWMLSGRLRSSSAAVGYLSAALLVCIIMAPTAWASWTPDHYTRALRDKFSGWRRNIPLNAQVLWPDNPVGAWYLLERSSYWSPYQVAGDIFSRPKSLEIRRRQLLIEAAVRESTDPSGTPQSAKSDRPDPMFISRVGSLGIKLVCADPALDFFVAPSDLGPTPFAVITPNRRNPGIQLHLYRCANVRSRPDRSPTAAGSSRPGIPSTADPVTSDD